MAKDTSLIGEPGMKAPRPMHQTVGGVLMPPSSSECNCDDDAALPLAVARLAIRGRTLHPDALLDFRKELGDRACPVHDSVSYSNFYEVLWNFAYLGKWGDGYRVTLAQAAAEQISRELKIAPDKENPELLETCFSLVDQATGRLGIDRVAYMPTQGKNDQHPPTMYGFVKHRANWAIRRVLKKDQRNFSVEEALRESDDSEVRSPGTPNAKDLRALALERGGESEIEVLRIQSEIREAGKLIHNASKFELQLIGLLSTMLVQIRVTPTQRGNFEKALRALTGSMLGQPGHCIVLDCSNDFLPINLATHISAIVASQIYGSPNSTTLTGQIAKWADRLLGAVAQDTSRSNHARHLIRSALEKRAHAHSKLAALTENLSSLDGADPVSVVGLWLGMAQRDRTDLANGLLGVGGVGIGRIPFLFGLIDPLSESAPGLAQLIAEQDDREPAEIVIDENNGGD